MCIHDLPVLLLPMLQSSDLESLVHMSDLPEAQQLHA